MSEKRFVVKKIDDDFCIINSFDDNIVIYCHSERAIQECCDLLNEQQATIEQKDKEIAELDQQCADFLGARIKAQEEWEKCTDKLKEKIVEQQATIEQLRTQLLICQQSRNDDGRFQVWEVPPIKKGMRITSFTTSDGEKDE